MKEKMGGVGLEEGKNGGSILRGRKKWGEYTLAAEGRAIMSTPPPSGGFWHLSLEGKTKNPNQIEYNRPPTNPMNIGRDYRSRKAPLTSFLLCVKIKMDLLNPKTNT